MNGAFSQRSSTLNAASSTQQLSSSSRGGGRKPMPGAPVKSRSTTGTDIAAQDSTGMTNKKNSDAMSNGTGNSSSLAKA